MICIQPEKSHTVVKTDTPYAEMYPADGGFWFALLLVTEMEKWGAGPLQCQAFLHIDDLILCTEMIILYIINNEKHNWFSLSWKARVEKF